MKWILNGSDERLPELWPGSVDLTDAALELVLAAAAEACEAFQPRAAAANLADELPASWVYAQILQARGIARAGTTGTGDTAGFGETVTVYPMDWNVKQLLRPRKAPVIA